MPRRDHKVLISARIDADVARRVRDLVRRRAGEPDYMRLGSFIQEAIELHLAATEARIAASKAGLHPFNNRVER